MARVGTRRHDLDWLRVLAVLGVFVFHNARLFNDHGWHGFNRQSSPVAPAFVPLFSQWGVPFIFVDSGSGIAYAVRPGQAVRFLGERLLRPLVPLVLGLILLAPPQVYLERLTHAQFRGSLLDFLPHHFDGLHGSGVGDFAWQGLHLWYLVLLFGLTILLLPLFVALKGRTGEGRVAGLGHLSRFPCAIFVWALALGAVMAALDPNGLGMRDFGGWGLFTYPFFLLFGFMIYASSDVQWAIVRYRWTAVLLAAGLSVALFGLAPVLPRYPFGTLTSSALMLVNAPDAWSWIMMFLGFGLRHLQRGSRLLPFANEAVLPLHVLHQPASLFVGHSVVQWDLPIWIQWLILTPTALALLIGVYAFGIRRWSFLRTALGLKRRPGAVPARVKASPLD